MLTGLSLGCGRLLEVAADARLPGPLVVPSGFALVVVAGELTTLTGATAELTGPLVIALAVAGLLSTPLRRNVPEGWAMAAAAAVFAVFAAPIVLSGRATFAGYVKLDDTATYLAMTDRVMEHGRSLAGLAPSTYEATLATTLAIGYPTGSLVPLGVGHQLLSYDSAWLFQPYLAFLAAMLALSLYGVLSRLVPSRPMRAFAAFVAAQPALLFGYSLWGGIKELAGAWLLALLAALLPWVFDRRVGRRAVLPLAAAVAALLCVLSLPGAVWLVPVLLAGAALVVQEHSRALWTKLAALAASIAVLSIPAFVAAVDWLPHVGSFRSESELGNLIRPLDTFQVFGIWPVGDFRLHPHDSVATYILIAVVIGAALVGLWAAWRSRSWALLAYVATAAIGGALLLGVSSPWVDGKALATAAPAVLAAALAGCAAVFGLGRRVEATVAAVAIAGGVLWSNALAYHDVWLAPRGQLHELEAIGNRYAGDGPALMTSYEPYGVRHFLRRLDPEGASELRRRFVYLRDGRILGKGLSADIDRFRLDGVLVYRTLVLRRGPAASRPPSVYHLVTRGRYYEVWQRPVAGAPTILEHLSLGSPGQAAAVPSCADVLRLGRLAEGGLLVTATRPPAITVAYPPTTGTVVTGVTIPSAGRYTAWLGGSWAGLASVSIDGRKVGARRAELNWPGNYTDLGSAVLSAGRHVVELSYHPGGWRPASGGGTDSFGPLVLSGVDEREPVVAVSPDRARSLCGRRLDWIEAVR